MKGKHSSLFWGSSTLFLILVVEILVGQFLPQVTFTNKSYMIINNILSYFAFSGSLIGYMFYFQLNKIIKISLGFFLVLFFLVNSFGSIFPFDTTTDPEDIYVLKKFDNGTKLVVRKYENVKTHTKIQDTLVVKDWFIFRKFIK